MHYWVAGIGPNGGLSWQHQELLYTYRLDSSELIILPDRIGLCGMSGFGAFVGESKGVILWLDTQGMPLEFESLEGNFPRCAWGGGDLYATAVEKGRFVK